MIEESEPEECDVDFDSMSSSSSILARWLVLFLLFLLHQRLDCRRQRPLFISCMCVLGQFSTQCKEIAKAFPRSIYLARGRFCEKSLFKRLVVCRKCKRVYPFQDCVEMVGGKQKSKLCPFQRFPQHTQHRMRKPCDTPWSSVGSRSYIPILHIAI